MNTDPNFEQQDLAPVDYLFDLDNVEGDTNRNKAIDYFVKEVLDDESAVDEFIEIIDEISSYQHASKDKNDPDSEPLDLYIENDRLKSERRQQAIISCCQITKQIFENPASLSNESIEKLKTAIAKGINSFNIVSLIEDPKVRLFVIDILPPEQLDNLLTMDNCNYFFGFESPDSSLYWGVDQELSTRVRQKFLDSLIIFTGNAIAKDPSILLKDPNSDDESRLIKDITARLEWQAKAETGMPVEIFNEVEIVNIKRNLQTAKKVSEQIEELGEPSRLNRRKNKERDNLQIQIDDLAVQCSTSLRNILNSSNVGQINQAVRTLSRGKGHFSYNDLTSILNDIGENMFAITYTKDDFDAVVLLSEKLGRDDIAVKARLRLNNEVTTTFPSSMTPTGIPTSQLQQQQSIQPQVEQPKTQEERRAKFQDKLAEINNHIDNRFESQTAQEELDDALHAAFGITGVSILDTYTEESLKIEMTSDGHVVITTPNIFENTYGIRVTRHPEIEVPTSNGSINFEDLSEARFSPEGVIESAKVGGLPETTIVFPNKDRIILDGWRQENRSNGTLEIAFDPEGGIMEVINMEDCLFNVEIKDSNGKAKLIANKVARVNLEDEKIIIILASNSKASLEEEYIGGEGTIEYSLESGRFKYTTSEMNNEAERIAESPENEKAKLEEKKAETYQPISQEQFDVLIANINMETPWTPSEGNELYYKSSNGENLYLKVQEIKLINDGHEYMLTVEGDVNGYGVRFFSTNEDKKFQEKLATRNQPDVKVESAGTPEILSEQESKIEPLDQKLQEFIDTHQIWETFHLILESGQDLNDQQLTTLRGHFIEESLLFNENDIAALNKYIEYLEDNIQAADANNLLNKLASSELNTKQKAEAVLKLARVQDVDIQRVIRNCERGLSNTSESIEEVMDVYRMAYISVDREGFGRVFAGEINGWRISYSQAAGAISEEGKRAKAIAIIHKDLLKPSFLEYFKDDSEVTENIKKISSGVISYLQKRTQDEDVFEKKIDKVTVALEVAGELAEHGYIEEQTKEDLSVQVLLVVQKLQEAALQNGQYLAFSRIFGIDGLSSVLNTENNVKFLETLALSNSANTDFALEVLSKLGWYPTTEEENSRVIEFLNKEPRIQNYEVVARMVGNLRRRETAPSNDLTGSSTNPSDNGDADRTGEDEESSPPSGTSEVVTPSQQGSGREDLVVQEGNRGDDQTAKAESAKPWFTPDPSFISALERLLDGTNIEETRENSTVLEAQASTVTNQAEDGQTEVAKSWFESIVPPELAAPFEDLDGFDRVIQMLQNPSMVAAGKLEALKTVAQFLNMPDVVEQISNMQNAGQENNPEPQLETAPVQGQTETAPDEVVVPDADLPGGNEANTLMEIPDAIKNLTQEDVDEILAAGTNGDDTELAPNIETLGQLNIIPSQDIAVLLQSIPTDQSKLELDFEQQFYFQSESTKIPVKIVKIERFLNSNGGETSAVNLINEEGEVVTAILPDELEGLQFLRPKPSSFSAENSAGETESLERPLELEPILIEGLSDIWRFSEVLTNNDKVRKLNSPLAVEIDGVKVVYTYIINDNGKISLHNEPSTAWNQNQILPIDFQTQAQLIFKISNGSDQFKDNEDKYKATEIELELNPIQSLTRNRVGDAHLSNLYDVIEIARISLNLDLNKSVQKTAAQTVRENVLRHEIKKLSETEEGIREILEFVNKINEDNYSHLKSDVMKFARNITDIKFQEIIIAYCVEHPDLAGNVLPEWSPQSPWASLYKEVIMGQPDTDNFRIVLPKSIKGIAEQIQMAKLFKSDLDGDSKDIVANVAHDSQKIFAMLASGQMNARAITNILIYMLDKNLADKTKLLQALDINNDQDWDFNLEDKIRVLNASASEYSDLKELINYLKTMDYSVLRRSGAKDLLRQYPNFRNAAERGDIINKLEKRLSQLNSQLEILKKALPEITNFAN